MKEIKNPNLVKGKRKKEKRKKKEVFVTIRFFMSKYTTVKYIFKVLTYIYTHTRADTLTCNTHKSLTARSPRSPRNPRSGFILWSQPRVLG